jgi:hypothetical protein
LAIKKANTATWIAAMLGFGAVVVYALEALAKFLRWRKGKQAQGGRIVEHAQPLTILT